MRRSILSMLLAALVPATAAAQRGGGPAGPQQTSTPEPLKFRYMGPAPAGRIASVSGVPGDPQYLLPGFGIGRPVEIHRRRADLRADLRRSERRRDRHRLPSPTRDPNIVWVGTGEPWVIRYSDVMGDGVYKSKDAGKTWKHMGLAETGRISRVLIHPTNPNIVYVCAQGRLTGPQEERGVFKTTDGGANWQRVLFVDREHRLLGPRRWTRTIRTRCSPAPGRSSSTRGRS